MLIRPYISMIDKFNTTIGLGCSALLLVMLLNNSLIVILRYGFNSGWIALQEALIYQHAIVLLLAAPLALKQDKHVRVDLVFNRQALATQRRINRYGILFLLWPFCATVFILSLPYVYASWQVLEGSSEAGGLPTVFLLKSLLLVFPVLLALQGLVELYRNQPNPSLPHAE